MKFSYSNVGTFNTCPYQWYLKYHEKLKTIPKTDPGNALWLGLGLHKGIECSNVEAGLEEYKSHFYMITDDHINWMIQLEHQIPRVLDLLPQNGEHEIKIETDEFIGFIDYVCGDTLYDFKFVNPNNISKYLDSPQLSIYKYFLAKVRPDIEINHLKYICVPKVNIRRKTRRKPEESIFEFRNRLQEELDKTEIQILEVPYNEMLVEDYLKQCETISQTTEFPKNISRLCDWCDFKNYCETDGLMDYEIIYPSEL